MTIMILFRGGKELKKYMCYSQKCTQEALYVMYHVLYRYCSKLHTWGLSHLEASRCNLPHIAPCSPNALPGLAAQSQGV